ncbi:hypothetical protein [Saccharopolyspora phatthalungensis]|uniref:Uncharacterized protein n=1 Tax=Saccharopolyspora phatthalungensis TaxID=664693 RepID=A0A840Q4V6_9PSEU|nr:hypothetical protein [Saccharopolyspora phatthalungensis]MBB5153719.1 hypothetical protein [Saccharopolyspora phatthalungensis]
MADEPLISLDAAGLAEHVAQKGFESDGIRYGVDAYRYLYRTTNFAGEQTIASGVVAFPRPKQKEELPLTVYPHGTNPVRGVAASVATARSALLLFAGTSQAAGSGPALPRHRRRGRAVRRSPQWIRQECATCKATSSLCCAEALRCTKSHARTPRWSGSPQRAGWCATTSRPGTAGASETCQSARRARK